MDALHRELQKIGGKGFLMSTTGMRWDWARAMPGTIHASDYALAGTMPLQNDTLYVPGEDLFQAYKTVLYAVKQEPSAEQAQELNAIETELASALVKKTDVHGRESRGSCKTWI